MALEKLLIGTRIRRIREETLEESRKEFANRCGLTERYIGQIERGEFLLSMENLDKISIATGFDTDYILYGKENTKRKKLRNNLINIIEKADEEQIKMLYKCITTIIGYVNKNN